MATNRVLRVSSKNSIELPWEFKARSTKGLLQYSPPRFRLNQILNEKFEFESSKSKIFPKLNVEFRLQIHEVIKPKYYKLWKFIFVTKKPVKNGTQNYVSSNFRSKKSFNLFLKFTFSVFLLFNLFLFNYTNIWVRCCVLKATKHSWCSGYFKII